MQIDLKERLAAKSVRSGGGCLLWKGTLNNGYGQIKFQKNKKQASQWYTHRLTYVIAYGPIPDGYGVKQACGDKTCIEPSHLVLIEMPWTSYDQEEMRSIYTCGGVIEVERHPRPRKEKPPKKPKIKKTDDERFEEKIRYEGDCWIFLHERYFYIGSGKQVSARRYSYCRFHQIGIADAPALLVVSCGDDRCVNPTHLGPSGSSELCRCGNPRYAPGKPCHDCSAEYHRRYNRKNSKKKYESARKWKKSHPEKARQANRESRRTIKHRQRAKELGLPPGHSTKEWRAVVKAQNGICNHCRRKRTLTRDHIVPMSRGGTNDISNIQGLCMDCNTAKGEMDWQMFQRVCPHRQCGARKGMPVDADTLPGLVA